MIMFMLKNKTHIEIFPDIHIVEEYNNNEFKSSFKKIIFFTFVPEDISANIG